MVKDFFGKEPHKGVNPDEVVAIGAAVQAGVLVRRREGPAAPRRDAAVASASRRWAACSRGSSSATPPSPRARARSSRPRPTARPRSRSTCCRASGRMARDNRTLGKFQLVGHPARAARRAADRGHVRHRRQRHRQRLGQGPRHGQDAEHHHHRLLRPGQGRGREDGAGGASRTPTRTSTGARRSRPATSADTPDLRDREDARREQGQARARTTVAPVRQAIEAARKAVEEGGKERHRDRRRRS